MSQPIFTSAPPLTSIVCFTLGLSVPTVETIVVFPLCSTVRLLISVFAFVALPCLTYTVNVPFSDGVYVRYLASADDFPPNFNNPITVSPS